MLRFYPYYAKNHPFLISKTVFILKFFLDSICMTLQNDVLLTRLINFCIIFFQETR